MSSYPRSANQCLSCWTLSSALTEWCFPAGRNSELNGDAPDASATLSPLTPVHAPATTSRKIPQPAGGPGRRSTVDSFGQTLLRARLLFSSYAPLNLILFLRIDGNIRLVFMALAVIGLLDASRLT